jgi:hypothetical protein
MTISFDDNVILHGMKATHERFLHPPIGIISPVQLQQPPQPLHYFLYNIFEKLFPRSGLRPPSRRQPLELFHDWIS